MDKKNEYLRFQARRLDIKKNRDYNVNYVSLGVSRVEFSKVVAKRELDISDLTIANKVMKGTNPDVYNMLESYPNKIILFREVWEDGKWNRIILEEILVSPKKRLRKI
jgi:hypothetical protein